VKATRLCSLVLIWAALSVAARGGEKIRVKGKGWAWPKHPAVTNDPPASFVREADKHDPETGEVFNGLKTYQLRHGVKSSDKRHWASTDFIHWTVHGATLVAKGRVHDGDPRNTSKATSKAWGTEEVLAEVVTADGLYGWIGADNRVSFDYAYTIEGAYIGTASVQLQGHAYDIRGKRHDFNASDRRGSKIAATMSKKTGFEKKAYANIKGHFSNGPKGKQAYVAGSLGKEKTEYESLDASITYRYPGAGSGNASTPEVHVLDEVKGKTPLQKLYTVSSDGYVALSARMAEGAEAPGAGPVVVDLDKFRILNSLRVWKSAGASEQPGILDFTVDPEEFPPPDSGSGSSGGGSETSGGGSGSSGGGSGTSGGGADSGSDGKTSWMPGDEVVFLADEPHGLEGETGSLAGLFRVRLTGPAAEETTFLVGVAPDGLLDLGAGDTLRIGVGWTGASLPFHALAAGSGFATLRRLDASGVPVGNSWTIPVDTTSTAAFPEARFWTLAPDANDSGAGDSVALHGLCGGSVRLAFGRTGFADIDSLPMVVTVAVEDPDGVLLDPPPQLDLAPGVAESELLLQFSNSAGMARLLLTAGEEVFEVVVVAREQVWESAALRIPLGTVAALPAILRWPETDSRSVHAVPDPAGLVTLDENEPELRIEPGELAWFFRVRAERLGMTSVRLESAGLPPLVVAVEVVAPEVSIEAGELRLMSLPAAAEGAVELWAPAGAKITGLDLPASVADSVSVTGVGTDRVVLTFMPSPDMPTELAFPIRFEGEPEEIGVLDGLRPALDAGNRHNIHVRVR